MFYRGQRVEVARSSGKVAIGSTGVVVGFYQFFDYDDDRWDYDESLPLIQFDADTTVLTDCPDWNDYEDANCPEFQFYMDEYFLKEIFEGSKFENKKTSVESRHIEHKKRMLL